MTTTIQTITPRQLKEIREAEGEIDLIDVRTPLEFREIHSTLARNVPLDALDPAAVMASRRCDPEKPLYVICRSGSRAAKACEAFFNAGFTNVVNVEGGTQAWESSGLPVIRGKKGMSLERQVRIAAGFLVVLGVGLSFLHPWFIALSAFVGAGLMFAGITDTCAMGMMIAKMPWNKVDVSASAACHDEQGAACSS